MGAHDMDRFKGIPGLDVNLQFVEKEELGWDTDVGGSIHYTMSKHDDDGDDAKEEEDEEDDGILMSVHTFPNTLSITYRSEAGVMSFVKYVNHKAPCSKIDMNQIWQVEDDDDDETVEKAEKRKLDTNENPDLDAPPNK